ncbi:MAG: glycosyltransferase [Flavobacteriaceae bacterium]|nr:glycosyltransferase [Flavobacteriaceae bacterium]
MDLLIKSFNRPYYLDRCIQSIYLNVRDNDINIIILDDGTPKKYLDKLTNKYPAIKILKSDLYSEKSKAIVNGDSNVNSKIPIDLWINAAEKASNYFLLIEDDFWFTKPIHLKKIRLNLESDKIKILKLCWLGNSNLLPKKTERSNNEYSIFTPNLYTTNPYLFNLIFRFHRFKIRKILTFLNFYSLDRFLEYYTIYSTSGAIFKKKYFLNLWRNHNNSVDEGLQLLNAVKYLNSKKKKQYFGFTNTEYMRTGFLSSASNQNKKYDKVNFNMFNFNKIINEAWLNDIFDAMENYPNDLNSLKIEELLVASNNFSATSTEWKKWVSEFKNQYLSFGCNID